MPGSEGGRRKLGVVAACPGVGLCCVSRAGLFLPRTTAASAEPWAHFVLSGAATPRSPTRDGSGLDTPDADELAIGGRRLDPGDPSPPHFENLTRSTSGDCRPHGGVLREPLAGYFGLPPFYLI